MLQGEKQGNERTARSEELGVPTPLLSSHNTIEIVAHESDHGGVEEISKKEAAVEEKGEKQGAAERNH